MSAWLWIVIDGQRPVAFCGNQRWANLYCRRFAQSFSTYADAYAARQEIRGRFYGFANAAPSADDPKFKMWMRRAEEVVIVRVLVA